MLYSCCTAGKTGLGQKAFVAQKQVETKAREAKDLSTFRLQKQASLMQMKCRSDLRKSRLACHQLDTEHGHTAPLENWHWPEELLPKVQKEEEEEEEQWDEEEEEEEKDVCGLYQPSEANPIIIIFSLLSNLKRLLLISAATTFTAFGVEQLIKVHLTSVLCANFI